MSPLKQVLPCAGLSRYYSNQIQLVSQILYRVTLYRVTLYRVTHLLEDWVGLTLIWDVPRLVGRCCT